MNSAPRSWILTDGKQGMESQCLGLMEALDLEPEILRITPRFPWSILPPQLWLDPLSAPGPDGDRLAPPWPDLLISTGRQTVASALAIKRIQQDQIVTIQLQNPTVGAARFDLVIAPAHDGLSGANVVSTLGALHRITPDRMHSEATLFADRYASLPRPLVAVLLGGDNSQFRMTAASADRLGVLLADAAQNHGAGLAVTSTGTDILAARTHFAARALLLRLVAFTFAAGAIAESVPPSSLRHKQQLRDWLRASELVVLAAFQRVAQLRVAHDSAHALPVKSLGRSRLADDDAGDPDPERSEQGHRYRASDADLRCG